MNEYRIMQIFKDEMLTVMRLAFPEATTDKIIEAIECVMIGKMKNSAVILENKYKDKNIDSTLLDTMEYILSRDPIVTPFGVMFKKPEEEENLLVKLTVSKFLAERKIHKKTMFTYPKGSDMFNHYNLLQTLSKVDANGTYGAIGNASCLFYNLNVAASITSAGQSAISVAAMAFESFLANNVKFRRLNEITKYITNVIEEKRQFFDHNILDTDISRDIVFEKLIETCGHGYLPTEDDLVIVWMMLCQLGQTDLNRLFYKSNLFAFMKNSSMETAMIKLLTMLESPYLNPNEIPEEISVELEVFWELLEEYVFYNHGYIDRIDRLTYLPRKVTAIIDTDSNIVVLDPWFKYWRERTLDIPMEIKNHDLKFTVNIDGNEVDSYVPFTLEKIDREYDIVNDEILEIRRSLDEETILAEDGLRYSIINILAFCLNKMVNSAMVEYTKCTGTYRPGKVCKLNMKNEFLFKTLLLVAGKKNYASIVELQEGVKVDNLLDIKGMTIDKASVNETTQKALQAILYDDILKDPNMSPTKVIRKLMVVEKDIFNSLSNKSKDFYKPATIKSLSNYDDPMRSAGIKASLVWNILRDPKDEAIDMNIRNAIDIVKINLTPKTAECVIDKYPELYQRILELFKSDDKFKNCNAIAIPLNTTTPDWVLEFIDYNTIINDNLTNFSSILESLGIKLVNKSINYTNVINL